MTMIPPQHVNPNGLHQRYNVTHVDGSPVDPMATYFVLRLDHFGRDGVHVNACRQAAIAYAKTVQGTHLEQVGADLLVLIENSQAMGRRT